MVVGVLREREREMKGERVGGGIKKVASLVS